MSIAANAVGDFLTNASTMFPEKDPIMAEVIRLGVPDAYQTAMEFPIATIGTCVMGFSLARETLSDAIDALAFVSQLGFDDPYWFNPVRPVADGDAVRPPIHVEQAMRALRGCVHEITDILIQTDDEFGDAAPHGESTPKLREIAERSKEKSIAIAKFLIEFFFAALPARSTARGSDDPA